LHVDGEQLSLKIKGVDESTQELRDLYEVQIKRKPTNPAGPTKPEATEKQAETATPLEDSSDFIQS